MIKSIIQYFKKQLGAGTVNAIASISVLIVVLMFIWSLWTGRIDNVIMFASGAGVAVFIIGMLKAIKTPQN